MHISSVLCGVCVCVCVCVCACVRACVRVRVRVCVFLFVLSQSHIPMHTCQCTLIPCGRVLMHPYPSVCIWSAQVGDVVRLLNNELNVTAERVHPIPALTIVDGLI